MDRRRFLLTSLPGALAAPVAAEAQQAGKVWRIGLLDIGRAFLPDSVAGHRAFEQGLQEHGYIVGQNITIEFRGAAGKQERMPELAAELVRLRVDILVTASTLCALAAKDATPTIPIVMVAVGDPVGSGLAASLARPGMNMTGLSDMNPDLSAKRLELLKEVMPKLTRAAVLLNPAHPPNSRQLEETKTAARTLGIALQTLEVRRSDDFGPAFRRNIGGARRRGHRLTDALTVAHANQIAEVAAKNRLPTMFGVRSHVEAGGLMAYGTSLASRPLPARRGLRRQNLQRRQARRPAHRAAHQV